MLFGSRSVALALLATLGVVGSFLAYDTLGYLSIAFLIMLMPLIFKRLDMVYLSMLSFSFVLVALVNNVYAYLISALTSAIATLYIILYHEKGKGFKTIRTPLLVFIPAYIILPRLLIPVLTSLSVTLFQVVREYLRLSRSRVRVYVSNPTTYLGAWVGIVVDVVCPKDFVYGVQVDGDTYLVGVSRDRVSEVVKVKATRLGTVKNVVRVTVRDRRELVSIVHEPYVVEYKVIPKFSELLKESRRVLTRYATYLSVPLILRVTTSFKSTSVATGAGMPVLNAGVQEVRPSEEPTSEVSTSAGGEAPVGYGSTFTGYGQAGEVGREGFRIRISWEVPNELVNKVFKALSSYVGDYVGVREYQSGDSPRLIHWKKSLRRDEVEDLAVKVYSDAGEEGLTGWGRTVVLADLNTTNPEELDLLLQTLYGYILSLTKNSSGLLGKLYLYLITPNNETYFIEGKVVDVLLALNTLVLEGKLTTQYDYSSQLRVNPPISGIPSGVIGNLVQYYRFYGQAIINDLRSRGVEGGSLTLIYCKSLTFKYYILSTTFSEYGFKVLTPGANV